MSGRIEFAMNFGANSGRQRQQGNGGRIYLIGDFSGANKSDSGLPTFVRIDRDNFDDVIAKLKPTLAPQPGVKLEFSALEDFHPDAWLHKVKATADLLQLKRQLQNPATSAQAAANIKALLPASAADHPASAAQPAAEIDDQMWLRLLGKVPEDSPQQPDPLSQWLQQTVSPHTVQPVAPQQQDLLNIVDLLLGQFSRHILHESAFQRLEALWRATLALLQEEQAEQYSVFLIDMDQAALQQALSEQTAAFSQRLLSHIASADDESEVLLVADVIFGADSAADGQLLQDCRSLAQQCGGRFIAGVDGGFCQHRLDSASKSQAFNADLLLAYPRYLARLPYGPKTDAIDGFDFVEIPDQPTIAQLSWATGAFLLARTVMRGDSEDGGLFSDVAVFSYSRDGEPALQPATETLLSEAQANALLACGIVPLIGFHQRQGVRVLFR